MRSRDSPPRWAPRGHCPDIRTDGPRPVPTWSAAPFRCFRGVPRRSATCSSTSRVARVGAFRDITFSVRAGEIVGLAGLVGAGRTESPASCSASIAPTRARFCSRASGCASRRRPKRCEPASPTSRKIDIWTSGCRLLDRGERFPADRSPALPAPLHTRQSRAQSRSRLTERLEPVNRRGGADRSAVRREAAEGGHREVAGHGAAGAHPRRTYSQRKSCAKVKYLASSRPRSLRAQGSF